MLCPRINLLLLLWTTAAVNAWSPPAWAASVAAAPTTDAATKDSLTPPKRVAVVGATGRTGRYVVQELAQRFNFDADSKIVALIRSPEKARQVFADLNLEQDEPDIDLISCDLTSQQAINSALTDVDAVIWCATGFSSEQSNTGFVEKAKTLLGIATKRTIDTLALPLIVQALKENNDKNNNNGASSSSTKLPQIIMCSSAGVTRPTWDEAKQAQFPGAADIPIVRLNPFGILDIKRESEEALRATCLENDVPYTIVRPCGLNDNWPAGSRPVVSQGDVAVGRMNRRDVAALLVDMALEQPGATGKTLEVIGLCNYPKGDAAALTASLERCVPDDGVVGPTLSLEQVAATYATMQQLLPGETQDAAALAMGQTYEQLDRGQVGRLGERGTENVQEAGLTRTDG